MEVTFWMEVSVQRSCFLGSCLGFLEDEISRYRESRSRYWEGLDKLSSR